MAFSFHNADVIYLTAGDQIKPKIITFYNTIKGGVDNVNELFPVIYIGQMTRRWLMMTFFMIIYIVAINCYFIHICMTLTQKV